MHFGSHSTGRNIKLINITCSCKCGCSEFCQNSDRNIPRDREESDDDNDYQASHGKYGEAIFGECKLCIKTLLLSKFCFFVILKVHILLLVVKRQTKNVSSH